MAFTHFPERREKKKCVSAFLLSAECTACGLAGRRGNLWARPLKTLTRQNQHCLLSTVLAPKR
eukprot:scaffold21565_cov54-Cyclotella_meneghiniana.AAC.2